MSAHPELAILVVLAHVVYSGGIGLYVAVQKGRSVGEGFWLGILAGPFGWLVVAMMPPIAGARTGVGSVRSRDESARSSAPCR